MSMKSNQIWEMVNAEIGDRWDLSNAHGVDLAKNIVQPKKALFWDEGGKEQVELWVVLEEDIENEQGYKIVFDERTNMFGLACTFVGKGLTYLGPYGSFIEAYESM